MRDIVLLMLAASLSILIFCCSDKDSVEVNFKIPLVRLEIRAENKDNLDGHRSYLENK